MKDIDFPSSPGGMFADAQTTHRSAFKRTGDGLIRSVAGRVNV
jgi:hypothetical protein